jgi:hypothetical protein
MIRFVVADMQRAAAMATGATGVDTERVQASEVAR